MRKARLSPCPLSLIPSLWCFDVSGYFVPKLLALRPCKSPPLLTGEGEALFAVFFALAWLWVFPVLTRNFGVTAASGACAGGTAG
jgi:hypothetical protein